MLKSLQNDLNTVVGFREDRGGESRQRLVAPPPRQYRQPGQGQDIAGDSLPRGPSDFFVDCSANATPSFIVTTSSLWGIRGHHVESGQDAWHPGVPEVARVYIGRS